MILIISNDVVPRQLHGVPASAGPRNYSATLTAAPGPLKTSSNFAESYEKEMCEKRASPPESLRVGSGRRLARRSRGVGRALGVLSRAAAGALARALVGPRLAQSAALRVARPAHEQVLVRLPVLGAHDHVDDGVDAGGQVDAHVAGNVEHAVVEVVAEGLGHGDGQVADDERGEDDEDHLEQLAVLGRHAARLAGAAHDGGHGRAEALAAAGDPATA